MQVTPKLKVTKGRPPRCRATIQWVPLRCLTRCGDCATRPGEAHTTCLTAGLEQCSSTAPHRVELLGAPQGEPEKQKPSFPSNSTDGG